MAMNFLEFEQPIAELEAKIEELKFLGADSSVNITEEIKRLQSKSRALTNSIFANLTPWQITQLARHPQRPYTLDYVSMIFTDWHELHGDRMYSDDLAIVGGLGGALAIGVCDRLIMLQFSVYSVISPESCASILWKSTEKKEIAADAMGGTAERLKKLGLVDEVLKEPHGGAHRDPQGMAEAVKQSVIKNLAELRNQPVTQLLDARQARLRGFGAFRDGW